MRSLLAWLAAAWLAACLLAGGQQVAQAGQAPQSVYLIRGRVTRDVGAAVAHLRRFLGKRMAAEARCERLAVLLQAMGAHSLDTHHIAELALASADKTSAQYRRMDVESLRELYARAISSYLERGRAADAGLLELVGCLSSKFRSFDAKARAQLDEARLKLSVAQLGQLYALPLEALRAPASHRLALSAAELQPGVERALGALFGADSARAAQLLRPSERPAAPQVAASAPAAAAAAAAVATATAAAGVAEVAPPRPEVAPPQPEVAVEQLDEESNGYFVKMFAALQRVYNTLPATAKLGDRCHAYNFVINAQEAELGQELFMRSLVEGTAQHIATAGASERASLQHADERENFAFALGFASHYLQPVDPELLFDLQQCAQFL